MNIREESDKLIKFIETASDTELEAALEASGFGSRVNERPPVIPAWDMTPEGFTVGTFGLGASLSDLVRARAIEINQ